MPEGELKSAIEQRLQAAGKLWEERTARDGLMAEKVMLAILIAQVETCGHLAALRKKLGV